MVAYKDNLEELERKFDLRMNPTDKRAAFPVYICRKCGQVASYSRESVYPCQHDSWIPEVVTCRNGTCRNRWKLKLEENEAYNTFRTGKSVKAVH